MKVTRVTTIVPETGDTASDFIVALTRVSDGAIVLPAIVAHHDPFSDEQHVEIVIHETMP